LDVECGLWYSRFMVIDNVKPITQKVLFETLHDFFEQILAPEFEKINVRLTNVENRLTNVENRLTEVENQLIDIKKRLSDVESDVRWIKNDSKDLKADLPSNYDVENLKTRVTKLETAAS